MRKALATCITGITLLGLGSACSGKIDDPYSDGPNADSNAPWGSAAVGGGAGTAGSMSGKPGASGAGNSGSGNGGSDAPGAVTQLSCVTPAVGPSPLRRLTHTEYDNSVHDLLGDTTAPGLAFTADTQVGLFDNTAETQTVPVLLADQYLDAAVSLANGVSNVSTLMGCDPANASNTTCVRDFANHFGRRAYRRPLTTDEADSLVTLFNDTKANSDATTGARAMVAAVLASPNFLFRPELGATASILPNAKQLTPFELASRLSSLIWASLPDDTLLDAAQNGQLATKEQLATQARRMLGDPKSHDAVSRFYQQWLGLPLLDSATKDAAIYPQWNDALRAAMREETKRFIDYVLWQDDAKLSTLLSANYSFVNGPLAQLYGVAAPSDPNTFQKAMFDGTQRKGVLTQGSLMSAYASPAGSSPIKRGKLVRVRLLCQDLPDPPANVPAPPPPQQGVSTRERFAMHDSSPACSGCHHLIDGLGFGLEHYDGIGAFRSDDHGVAVDASGEINTTEDIDGKYEGGPELAGLLAGSEQVRDCAPTQWLRYSLGRRETDDDTCSLVALRKSFADSNGDLRELMVALTQTDAFWNYKQPE